MTNDIYDDLLPVSLHEASAGEVYLLDRHNDEIAVFGKTIEREDMQRIVDLINRPEKTAPDCNDVTLPPL